MKHTEVAEKMKECNIVGADFAPVCFTPMFSKYKGELCKGIQIFITDYDKFEPYRCGLMMLDAIRKTNSEFEFLTSNGTSFFIDKLAGTDEIRRDEFKPEEYIKKQVENVALFKKRAEKYQMYF